MRATIKGLGAGGRERRAFEVGAGRRRPHRNLICGAHAPLIAAPLTGQVVAPGAAPAQDSAPHGHRVDQREQIRCRDRLLLTQLHPAVLADQHDPELMRQYAIGVPQIDCRGGRRRPPFRRNGIPDDEDDDYVAFVQAALRNEQHLLLPTVERTVCVGREDEQGAIVPPVPVKRGLTSRHRRDLPKPDHRDDACDATHHDLRRQHPLPRPTRITATCFCRESHLWRASCALYGFERLRCDLTGCNE
jgi:hypothetical protein